ncbi:unnamed protein product, partial [Rotaria sordida]
KEKKQQSATNNVLSPDGEVTETISKSQSKLESSPPSSISEKSFVPTTGGIHHPTMIPLSSSLKNGNNLITKTGVVPPSILTRAQQNIINS